MNRLAAIRRSTLALAAVFLAASGTYVLVRPDPLPAVQYVPAVPVPSTTTTTARPATTTTTETATLA